VRYSLQEDPTPETRTLKPDNIVNQPNSQYLKWFHAIEKALWSFFALFGDMCARCAANTRQAVDNGERDNWESWCCCMIDNQVHDNWESLNAVQSRFDRNWYEPMRRPERPRMPGNGPCPALGPRGCLLAKCRPITCTTQLCDKMLRVLHELGIIKKPAQTELQIEDLIPLPPILPALYGTGKPRKVLDSEVDAYIAAVKGFRDKLANIPPERRREAVNRQLGK
jgi:hypothetical protein